MARLYENPRYPVKSDARWVTRDELLEILYDEGFTIGNDGLSGEDEVPEEYEGLLDEEDESSGW